MSELEYNSSNVTMSLESCFTVVAIPIDMVISFGSLRSVNVRLKLSIMLSASLDKLVVSVISFTKMLNSSPPILHGIIL